MAVNQGNSRPPQFLPDLALPFNIDGQGDIAGFQANEVIMQLHKAAEQYGWYMVPPSPPPPQAFMINDAEEVVEVEENVQDLVNAFDNVDLNQPGIPRKPNNDEETTRNL